MTDLCPSATMKVIEVAMHFLEIKAHYALEQPIDIVKDLSSAIRGVWGRSLRNIYCFQKQLDCINCSLVNCTYFVLFEKKLSNADQYHPYIIQSQVLNPNLIEARFKFFGWICEHSEKLLYSIINMNSRVLNRESVSHKLLLQDPLYNEQPKYYPTQAKDFDLPPPNCSSDPIGIQNPFTAKTSGLADERIRVGIIC